MTKENDNQVLNELIKYFNDNQNEYEKQMAIVNDKYPLVGIMMKMKDKIIKDNWQEKGSSIPDPIAIYYYDYIFRSVFENLQKLQMFKLCLRDCGDGGLGGPTLTPCQLECIAIFLDRE